MDDTPAQPVCRGGRARLAQPGPPRLRRRELRGARRDGLADLVRALAPGRRGGVLGGGAPAAPRRPPPRPNRFAFPPPAPGPIAASPPHLPRGCTFPPPA